MIKIAVIGAGIGGLTLGYYLSKKKYNVILFEKNQDVGGLGGTLDIENFSIERFYHHFFKTDCALLKLASELNIADKIIWNKSKVGVYCDKLYSMQTPFDLFKLNFLSLKARILFGLHTLFFQKKKDWQRLEELTVREWFKKYYSSEVYDKLWHKMFQKKFGEFAENISAAWLWGRIYPRAKSRTVGSEQLGYFKGGFKILHNKLYEKILENKGKILTNNNVKNIKKEKEGYKIETDKGIYQADKIIFTNSNEQIEKLYNISFNNKIKYFGVVCLILFTSKPFSQFYWLNIANENIPFGLIVEHTNFVGPNEYNGKYITYIVNYLPQNHKYFELTEEELFCEYEESLCRIYNIGKLELNKIIYSKFVTKSYYATPVYSGKYSEKITPYKIDNEEIYIANTSQIYPDDRNYNNGILNAKKLINEYFK